MTTLDATRPGQRTRVAAILGGMGLRRRLAGLGLTVGAEVETLIGHGRGPVVVTVRQTRLALGRGMASRIGVLSSEE